jgi:hypothetical protein
MQLFPLAALLLTAATTPPQQFDLICKGQWRFDLLDPFKPHDFRLRVDLAKKQYCEDPPADSSAQPCAVLHTIAKVQPGVIIFEEESGQEHALGIVRTTLVSRETGKYMNYEHEPARASVIDVEATCSPAAFSGFPKINTKF